MPTFTPKGLTNDIPPESFETLIEGINEDVTWISLNNLEFIIPRRAQNVWNPGKNDRIKKGFKYLWNSSTRRYEVHGHTRDPEAPPLSRARYNWVVRIRINGKYMLSKIVYPPTGPYKNTGTFWSYSNIYADLSHIPATSDDITDQALQ